MSDTAAPAAEPAPPALPTEVSIPLRGRDKPLVLQLVRPRSLTIRAEVTYAVGDNEPRALACALALCSSRLANAVGPYNLRPLDYGGRVLEHLLERGAQYLDVVAAGQVAWAHMSEGLLREPEVAAREARFPE